MWEGMRQVESVLGSWVTGDGQVQYTPAGLAWAQDWGSLRMTANAAFLAVVYAKQIARALLSHNQTPMHGMASHGRDCATPNFLRNANHFAVMQHRKVPPLTTFAACVPSYRMPRQKNRKKLPSPHPLSAGYTIHHNILPLSFCKY